MFNPFALISDLNDAAQAGKQMANPAVWSNRAQVTAYVTAALTSIVAIAGMFHVLPAGVVLDEETIKTISLGVAAVGSVVINFLHKASNPNAG